MSTPPNDTPGRGAAGSDPDQSHVFLGGALGPAALDRAFSLGVCGVAGTIDPPPRSPGDAVGRIRDAQGKAATIALLRFVRAERGSLVWVAGPDGRPRLGRVRGAWRYDGSREAAELGLAHTRACCWLRAPIATGEVPDAVVAGLSVGDGGPAWRRLRSEAAELDTLRIWLASGGDG